MRPIPTLACLVLAGACLTACDRSFDAELLEVRSVEPHRLEPGVLLEVRGEGFPTGRSARVGFIGTLRRPGAEPVRIDVQTEGHAARSDRIEVRVDEALLERVGGQGTFEGRVRVLFPAAGEGTVSGTLEGAELGFAPGASRRLPQQAENGRRARAVLRQMGVELEPEAPTADGLHVAAVSPGSAADAAGLVAGDRLRSIDGVRVEAVADFVPRPGTRKARVRVHRPDRGRTFLSHVALQSSPRDGAGATPPATLVVALALLALLLLFVAPTARLTAWVARVLVGSPRQGAGDGTPAAGPTRATRLQRIALRAFELAVDAAALASIPLCIRRFGGDLDVGVLLLSSLAARVVAVASERRPLPVQRGTLFENSKTPGWLDRGRRTRATLRFLGGGIPSAAAIGVAVILSGDVGLGGLVEAQGAAPWRWLAFENPLAFVLLPAFVAATVGAPVTGAPPVQATVASAADRVGRLIATTVAVGPFLGGWGPADWPLWLGVSLFVAKGLLVLAVGARLRRVQRPRVGAVLTSIACVAGAVAWLLADIPPSVASVAGPVLATAAVAVGAFVVWEMVRARRGTRQRPADVPVFL